MSSGRTGWTATMVPTARPVPNGFAVSTATSIRFSRYRPRPRRSRCSAPRRAAADWPEALPTSRATGTTGAGTATAGGATATAMAATGRATGAATGVTTGTITATVTGRCTGSAAITTPMVGVTAASPSASACGRAIMAPTIG